MKEFSGSIYPTLTGRLTLTLSAKNKYCSAFCNTVVVDDRNNQENVFAVGVLWHWSPFF